MAPAGIARRCGGAQVVAAGAAAPTGGGRVERGEGSRGDVDLRQTKCIRRQRQRAEAGQPLGRPGQVRRAAIVQQCQIELHHRLASAHAGVAQRHLGAPHRLEIDGIGATSDICQRRHAQRQPAEAGIAQAMAKGEQWRDLPRVVVAVADQQPFAVGNVAISTPVRMLARLGAQIELLT